MEAIVDGREAGETERERFVFFSFSCASIDINVLCK
jgi:hypothetical protein